jgi:hypothetical protein
MTSSRRGELRVRWCDGDAGGAGMPLVTYESDISLASCSDEHVSPNEGLDACYLHLLGLPADQSR